MFGDYIDRGSAGAIFSSPTNPDQVIKIINLDSLDDFTKSMNNQQFKFFEKLEEQQKQGIKTPGLPKIEYTFTGEMTPEIMDQIREAVLNHSEDYKDVDTDEYLSGLNYAAIKGNFRYGDKYAIILMDRISQIGSNYEYTESIGRRGLTPMLRHAHSMGYYVRDLWPANKGMSSDGNIIWFDPMVAPVNPITEEDRKAQRLLLDWNEETQRQYREAVRDQSYFDYEHKAGLFYSESEDDNYWLRGGCGKAAAMISKDLDQKNIPYHYEIGLAYTEEAFIGNHIVVISEKGDQDHYGTQGAKKRWENMLISELVDQELPQSMIDDIITFEWHKVDPKKDWSVEIVGEYLPVSGPMITKDTLGMSAEDRKAQQPQPVDMEQALRRLNGFPRWKLERQLSKINMGVDDQYHDCANCNRKNVDNEESDEDDACHMVGCGNYFCYQCMTDGHTPTFSLDDRRGSDEEEIQETYFGGSSPSVGKCCLQKAINLGFRMYSGYGNDGDWLKELVDSGHLPNQTYVSINYVLGGLDKMSAENYVSQDYPKCYLCNLPAKIEVGTALGMRSFCGNKCRGDYEGIDYGPDDYFISPKLEHEIYVFDYSPEEYNLKARSIIKCRNCDFVAEYTFDSNHMKLRGDWHLHKDENGDVLHPDEIGYCEHEMNVIKYISSGWDNQGSAIIRCKLCRFADEIRAEIPEGCNNRGQNNPKWFGSEQSNSDMHNKRVTLHRWNGMKYAGLNQKYPEVNYPMAINLSRQNYFAVPRKAFDGLAALFSADWEDIDWSPKINHIGDTVKWDSPHPTHKYISTSGIFYSPEGHIGLQLRSFNVMAPNTWSGISGFLDKGETPYEGVIREINEETGLSVDIIKNWKFSIIWDDGAHLTYIFHVDKEFYPEVNEYKWEWTDFKWAEPNSWKQVSNLHPGIVPLANVDFNQFN